MNLTGVTFITYGSTMEVVPTEVARKRSSPSKYRSIELSPAFVQDPDRPEHPVTAEGKELHRAVETGDDRGLPENLVRLAQLCRELITNVIPAGASVHKEIRFPIEGDDYGFADLVALEGSTAYMVDYKFGHNKQEEVETNPAAQAYVLGIFNTWPTVNRVKVWYAYPRFEEVSYGEYTRKDIPRILGRIQLIKDRHDKATPETCRYHDDTCVYCKFLYSCPTAAKVLLPVATRYAESHGEPVPAVTDFGSITSQKQWSKLLSYAPTFEALATSIKRHALEWRDATGIEIDGYTVTEKKGTRNIIDPHMAWEVAKERGVTEGDFLSCVEVSVPSFIKAVRETAGTGKKGLVEQQVVNQLMDAGAMTQNAPSRFLRRDKSTDTKTLENTEAPQQQGLSADPNRPHGTAST